MGLPFAASGSDKGRTLAVTAMNEHEVASDCAEIATREEEGKRRPAELSSGLAELEAVQTAVGRRNWFDSSGR